MTKEETEQLLEEAKRRYPVGTKYQCAVYPNRTIDCIYEVKEEQKFAVMNSNRIHGNPGKGCLKYNGVWAEIISFPKEIEFSPLQLLFQPLIN